MKCESKDNGRSYYGVVTRSFSFDDLEYTFDIVNMKQDGGICVAKVHYVSSDDNSLVSELKSSNTISIAVGNARTVI